MDRKSDLPELGATLLTWKGRSLYSSVEPESTVQSKIGSLDLAPGTLVFFPSPLQMWGLRELVSCLPADSCILLYEADPELKAWSRDHFFRVVGQFTEIERQKIFWLEAFSETEWETVINGVFTFPVRRVFFLRVNGGWLLNSQEYRRIEETIEREIKRFWSNRMTSMRFGAFWIRNLFRNLVAFSDSRESWPDWGQAPVVICGAGVSIENQLETLKKHRSRFRILAVDTALSILADAEIVPDAVVCVESQIVNLKDFSHWKNSKIPLFLDLTSHPATARVTDGPLHWFASQFADLKLLKTLPDDIVRIPALGSVGVVAVKLALSLTRGVCFMTGLDFSYPIGKTHARSAPALRERPSSRLLSSEQIGSWLRPGTISVSNSILSTRIMLNYAKLLEHVVSKEKDRAFVLESKGIDLGLTSIPASVDWTTSLKPLNPKAPTEKKTSQLTDSKSLKLWLAREVEKLDLFLSQTTEPTTQTIELLKEVDYVYFSFPDAHRIETPDSTWIARCRIVAQWQRNDLVSLLETWN